VFPRDHPRVQIFLELGAELIALAYLLAIVVLAFVPEIALWLPHSVK